MSRVSFENLATRTEKGRLPKARRRIGLPSRKTRQKSGPIDSTAIGADRLGTDTASFVSVAVSEARPRFATHFATDQQLSLLESASETRATVEGGRGSGRSPRRNRKSSCPRRKFSSNGRFAALLGKPLGSFVVARPVFGGWIRKKTDGIFWPAEDRQTRRHP